MRLLVILGMLIGLTTVIGCDSGPEIITKESGVRYLEMIEGTGVEAVDRMQVECHYTLWFADSTGLEKLEMFQSSKDGGMPFRCQLGVRLIPGWTDGMIGMKEGGTRRIYVPWELGYGDQEGGRIPAKTNLIFEILGKLFLERGLKKDLKKASENLKSILEK